MQKKLILIGFIVILMPLIFFQKNDDTPSKSEELVTSEEKKGATIYIDLKGEVLKEGVYEVESGSILNNLVEEVGLKDSADTSCVNLARSLEQNQMVIIPDDCSSDNIVNINTANAYELQSLPGIGETRANDIIEYRTNNGSFNTIEELMNVSGIGEATFTKIKDRISI